MRDYGKATARLTELGAEIAELKTRDREVRAEQAGKVRGLAELHERLREAEVNAEMVVLDEGPPVAKSPELDKIKAAIAKLAAEVQRDPWSSKLEAIRRKLAERESERLRFIRDHVDGLAAELVPAEVEGTDAIEAAIAALRDAIAARSVIAGDLADVLRVLPPPDDRSTYRLAVRSDHAMQALDNELRHAAARLTPLSPAELVEPEDEKQAA